jgi:hypothetical protein
MRRDVDLETQVQELSLEVERLTFAVIALAEILRDQHGVSADVLDAKMREIEGRGANLRQQAKRCTACDRVNGPERSNCMFCGQTFPREPLIAHATSRSSGRFFGSSPP